MALFIACVICLLLKPGKPQKVRCQVKLDPSFILFCLVLSEYEKSLKFALSRKSETTALEEDRKVRESEWQKAPEECYILYCCEHTIYADGNDGADGDECPDECLVT